MKSPDLTSPIGTVALRAPEPGDLDTLYIWENDPENWRVGWQCAPLSRKQIADYIAAYNADPFSSGELRLMVSVEGHDRPVGTVDLTDIDTRNRRAQVGIFIAPDFRGKGYAAASLAMVLDYAREFLGLHQLWSMVAVDNDAARSLFTSAGYKSCGRLRSWLRRGRAFVDVVVYQKLIV